MKFTWEKCPHCRKTLNFKSEGGAGWVEPLTGKPGVTYCPHCRGRISNAKEEWDDQNIIDKVVYLLRTVWSIFVVGIGGGLLVAVIFSKVFGLDTDYLPTIVFLWFAGCAFVWCRDAWLVIGESKARTTNRAQR